MTGRQTGARPKIAHSRVLPQAPKGMAAFVAVLFLVQVSSSICNRCFASQIEIASVAVRDDAGQLLLDADAALELNATIEAGLASGVPIFFNADVAIVEHRPFWFDKTVFKSRRRFALVYYELTRHYRVTVVSEDRSRNFRSLFDALEYIGTIRDLPIISSKKLSESERYLGNIAVSLDLGALPLPLRPQAFVSSAWRLQSKEHTWALD